MKLKVHFQKCLSCIIVLVSLSLCVFSVFADTPTQGTINTSALTYLSAVVYDIPLEDYVIYRSGEYVTTLVYGNLEFDNNTFTGVDVLNVVQYDQRGIQSDQWNYQPTVTRSTSEDFSLDVDTSSLIYSNLGSFASVDRESHTFEYVHFFVEFLFSVLLIISFFIFNRGKIHL